MLTFHYETPVDHTLDTYLSSGLSQNAFEKRGLSPITSHSYSLKNDMNELSGGVEFYDAYGCIFVAWLFIEKDHRGKGYGQELMTRVEHFAKEKGARFIDVNTMDFEALDFYKKLGFVVEFQRGGFDKDSILCFLRKTLSKEINA